MKEIRIAVAALLASITSNSPAAIAVGDIVTCDGGTFSECSTPSAVIGPGPEFRLGSDFQVDFSAGLLIFSYTGLAEAGSRGNSITFSDLTSPIGSFSLVSTTGVTGFDASHLSLEGNVLRLRFGGLGGSNPRDAVPTRFIPTAQGSNIVIALGSAVPEPSTWAMMIGGFGMVGGAMRRARRKQKVTVSYA